MRTARECAEGNLKPPPEVGITVVVASPERAFAEAGERVALRVDAALAVGGVRGVEEVAFLGGEEEEEAVDEPQQLLEEGLGRQVTYIERFT